MAWLNNHKYTMKALTQAVVNNVLTGYNKTVATEQALRNLSGNIAPSITSLIANRPAATFGTLLHILSAGTSVDVNEAAFIPVIGRGTTPVSADDYDLADTITKSNNYNVGVNEGVYDTASNSIKYSITIQCINEAGFTISEFGLTKALYTTNLNNPVIYLMYREVLPEPIALANGESVTISVSVPVPNF